MGWYCYVLVDMVLCVDIRIVIIFDVEYRYCLRIKVMVNCKYVGFWIWRREGVNFGYELLCF